MRKLKDMQLLAGQSETITMSQFRKLPGEVIAQLEMGKTFRISHRGKIVAVLSPPELTALEIGAEIRRMEAGK